MSQFFRGVGLEKVESGSKPVAQMRPEPSPDNASSSEVCDEIILESWSRSAEGDIDTNLVLIGDSHFGLIGKMLAERGVAFVGSGTMNASDWQNCRFDLDKERLFIPHDADQKLQWEKVFRASFGRKTNKDASLFVITNLGFQRNEAYLGFWKGYIPQVYGENYSGTIRTEALYAYLAHMRKAHSHIIYRLLAMGHTVLMVSDPPIEPSEVTPPFVLIENILLDYFKSIGCLTFNSRAWAQQLGGDQEDFRSDDFIHGSEQYYRQLIDELISHFKIGAR